MINKNKMKKIFCLLFGFSLTYFSVNAQSIDTARFHLNFRPTITIPQKINQQAKISDTVSNKVEFNYYITPQRLDLTFKPSEIKAAKMTPDVMKRLYRNFIKVGFGYPVTPLFELALHNPDNSKYSYGLNVHHFSSWLPPIGKQMKQYPYFPTSDTRVHLFFTRFFKSQTLYSSIGYNHEYANLYGYKKDAITYLPDYERYFDKSYRDSINNSFHHVKAEVGLRSNYVLEDRRLKQDVRLNYDFIRTYKKDIEHHIGMKSYFAYDARFMKISGSQNYKMGFDIDFYNNNWNDTILGGDKRIDNSVKVEFRPTVNFTIKEYHFLFGIGVPILHSYGGTNVPIYPIAEIQLGLIPGIMSLYGGVNGYSKFNSLQNLLYENPYVKPQLDTLKFTYAHINVYAGIKGNLVKKLNYHISAQYSFDKNNHFYMLDTTSVLRNRFDVIYRDVNTLNVCVNLNWEVIDQLYLNLEGNYWLHNFPHVTDSIQERAWYKPSWEVAFGGKYVFRQKMIFSMNFNLQFGRWALVPNMENHFTPQKMSPILDFGIGFEYLFTERFSAFARINNIACQPYAKYYDFRSFGINALAGVTFSFGNENLKRR